MTTTLTTRRRLLARSMSAMASVAAMAPVAASALCRLPAEGDAELLALGQELAPLVAEINVARALDRRDQEEFEAKLAALGLKSKEEYENEDAYDTHRWRLRDETRLHEEEPAERNRHRDWDDIHDEQFDLLEKILAIRATTREGFAVQVLAFVTAHDDLCYDEENETHSGMPAFFRRTCEFAGVPIPASGLAMFNLLLTWPASVDAGFF